MMLNTLLWSLLAVAGVANAKQPNILFILTDDQDNHMESVEHMKALKHHIIDKGTSYTHHYCTVALCCPSRASLWTGRHAHNHNVTSVKPPYGGYIKVRKEGINHDYLPIWMQDAGYNTYYVGKLWNAYGLVSMPPDPARGWTGSDILLDPWTYRYYHSAWSRDGGDVEHYDGQYSPDITASKASAYLDEALQSDKPWFLVAAPVAPHGQVATKPKKHPEAPPSAPRHKHLFEDYKIPRTPMFNPEQPAGASYIKHLPRLNEQQLDRMDNWQRGRLRALQSVDEMIDELVTKVEDAGVADNTYIIFSTDNGFHIGQYRMHPGKKCAYETDINIPLFIRGPNVPVGGMTDSMSAHVDFAPTFMKLAGQDMRDDFDGEMIPLTQEEFDSDDKRVEHMQAEFWGSTNIKGLGAMPNTYKATRIVGNGYNLLYTVWCNNEHELYDLNTDPYQMNNLYQSQEAAAQFTLFDRPFHKITHRLDALTMVLKSCTGDACRRPWRSLHPDGRVGRLRDALSDEFDDLYERQPRVWFDACALGYIREIEGPQHPIPSGALPAPEGTPSPRPDSPAGEELGTPHDELDFKNWQPYEGQEMLFDEMSDFTEDDSPELWLEEDEEFDSDGPELEDLSMEHWEI